MVLSQIKRVFLPLLVLALFTGCAGLGRDVPPEVEVREKAQAWADALMAEDFKAAWRLTSPAYRQFADWERYQGEVAGALRWSSATVDEVACEAEICKVRVMIEYEIKKLKVKGRRPLDYKWVRTDSGWWLHVPIK